MSCSSTLLFRFQNEALPQVRLCSEREGPYSSIELVSHVLHLVGLLGVEAGVDPGRPPVSKFGRKMYRNGFKASNGRTVRQTWIARKAEAIGLLPHESDEFLSEALDRFLERLSATRIAAVVSDYDGTLCGSHERYTGLSSRVAGLLDALLSKGLIVGIATGRGGSAHTDLRKALSPHHWNKVLLGLYNGATVLPLSEEETEQVSDQSEQLATSVRRLTHCLADCPSICHKTCASCRCGRTRL